MSGPRVLVTGATGLLGPYLTAAAKARELDAWFVGRTTPPDGRRLLACDLTDADAVGALWSQTRPDVVIHAAALTNVDLCEQDPALADSVNRRTAEHLSTQAASSGSRIVMVSTDSVFDGRRGNYSEDDEPHPLNVYAQTKLAAEQELAIAANHLVVRTNFFGRSARGNGLAEWLLARFAATEEVTGFTDVIFSPLYCGTLADALVELATGDACGTIHLGANDAVSKFDFAHIVAQAFGHGDARVHAGKLADAHLTAPRPLDTSLRVDTAASLLGPLPSVVEEVERLAAEHFAPAHV